MMDLTPTSGGRGSIPTPRSMPKMAHDTACETTSSPINHQFGLKATQPELIERSLKALNIINNLYTENGNLLVDIDFENPVWLDRGKIESALHTQLRLTEIMLRVGDSINYEILPEIDLDRIKENVKSYMQKNALKRFFDSSFSEAHQMLSKIASVPSDPEGTLERIDFFKTLQTLFSEATKNRRLWGKLLGVTPTPAEKKELKFWFRTSQFVLPLIEFCDLCNGHPDRARLFKLLREPSLVYDKL